MIKLSKFIIVTCFICFFLGAIPTSFALADGNLSSNSSASEYLKTVMDEFHTSYYVYDDAYSAGNHFSMRAKISSSGDENAVPPMDEEFSKNCYSGNTCIRATFKVKGNNWGGWYFMNGVLKSGQIEPQANWGDEPNAGVDLKGATKLTFWARGEKGGEMVEFFVFGIGRDPSTGKPIKPYPDSSSKVSLGYVELSNEWKKYTIDLSGRNLSYVLGGFGWVTNAKMNNYKNITFYLDEIRYNKPRLGEPRFLLSYKTISSNQSFDKVMRNVAFTYDNALALLAFLAKNDRVGAKLIADALVYAQNHDRFYTDGRLRNAYQAGDLALPKGWIVNNRNLTVRIPGWYDKGRWYENKSLVSTYTGNVAWAMIALLSYYETAGEKRYLDAAKKMGEWIEQNCRDNRGAGGYTAGFEGWEPNPVKITHKSTEHNIDLYVAFKKLYMITKENKWNERAEHAKKFILGMWDNSEGKFWTGTTKDGITINKDTIPLDIQAWAILALKNESKPYWKALEYAEKHMKVGNGFDFNQDKDGIWYEGTAQMALAYYSTNQKSNWNNLTTFLKTSQDKSGGIFASNKNGLTTGFNWLYFKRLHIGATAWLLFAQTGLNPFWLPKNLTQSTVSLGQLAAAASTIKKYYESYNKLPSTVNITGKMYTMSQLLYLLCRATINIQNGNLSSIVTRAVGNPTLPNGSYTYGRIYNTEYVKVASNILGFIKVYDCAPNYASTSLGRIPFQKIVYMYNKIMAFYGTNKNLPSYVTI